MNDVVIGVDLGSGAARAVALDRDGAVRAEAAAAYHGVERWERGHADATVWLDAFERAVRDLASRTPSAARPVALAVGGQSPTTIGPGGDAITCLHPAGAELDPHAQHQEQRRALRAGRVDAECEPMQLWDWVLVQLGAPRAQARWPGDPTLPGYGERVSTGAAVGEADGRHGVARGTPLVPGAQDAYLAFWAAGLDEPGRALDPGGRTGGLGVACAAGNRPAEMFALPSAVPGIDIVGGPVSAHGIALEWWAAMTGATVEELITAAASVPPGANGTIALPYFEGERAPRWNRELRAELAGITTATTRADVARALLESTAYGLAHIARELEAHGVPTRRLVVGGSPARSRAWCEIKAAVLEVPVEVPEHPELAAFGAGLAAGAAAQWWPSPGEGRAGDWPRPQTHVVDPAPREIYRERYAQFVELGDAAVERLVHRPVGAR